MKKNNKIYVNPISVSRRKKMFPPPSKLSNAKSLENKLREFGLDISLGQRLKGGVVSQVYEARLKNKKVIVKHTEDLTPFDPTEIHIHRFGHNVDSVILKKLNKHRADLVPEVLYHFADITTTVMEDVREYGFTLYQNKLLQGKVVFNSAEAISRETAKMEQILCKIGRVKVNESAEESIYERGLELRLAYPNNQSQFKYIEKEFTGGKKCLVAPDNHPKNIFVNNHGAVKFIDFGRSCYADQRYMFPNFLAHILIFGLAGYYSLKDVKKYFTIAIDSYNKIKKISDEKIFC